MLRRICATSNLATYVVALVYLTPPAAGQGKAAKDRFPEEALRQWEQYQSFSYRIQGKITTSTEAVLDDGQASKNQYECEIKQNGQCSLYLYRYFDERPISEGVIVHNPQYAFQVQKGRGKQEWFLANLDIRGDGAAYRGRPIREYTTSRVCLAFCLYDRPLSILIRDRAFKLANVSETSRNGRLVTRIDFTYSHPIRESDFYPIQSGTIYLDPTRYWCITEAKLKGAWTNGTGTIHETYEFRDGPDGFPIVTQVIHQLRHDSKRTAVKSIIQTDFTIAPNVPTREFTLSAFGLPEPNGVVWERGPRYYLWFGLGAGACVILMLLFRQLARRSAPDKA